jgi:ribonuclease Y
MIHQPHGGAEGQAPTSRSARKRILALRERLNKILAKNPASRSRKIERDVDRDFFMTADEAKKYGIVDQVYKRNPSSLRLQKLEAHGRERLEEKARNILTSAIHRLGNAVNAEVMTLSVAIPSEEMKGKIIGKEGRNIKAFERATGVDVLIDDAPDKHHALLLRSAAPPHRQDRAREAHRRRPHPAGEDRGGGREDAREVPRSSSRRAKQAAYEAGVIGLDPKLIALLGRLYFRTSYGQNVLQHSIEMAHIAGCSRPSSARIADVARAGALLHDIGKAVDHEVQGTHVEIGRRILEKFGVDKRVIQAMQSHHEEYPYETPESVIVQVADAISGGRPGARRDTVERYLERLGDLERVASSASRASRRPMPSSRPRAPHLRESRARSPTSRCTSSRAISPSASRRAQISGRDQGQRHPREPRRRVRAG